MSEAPPAACAAAQPLSSARKQRSPAHSSISSSSSAPASTTGLMLQKPLPARYELGQKGMRPTFCRRRGGGAPVGALTLPHQQPLHGNYSTTAAAPTARPATSARPGSARPRTPYVPPPWKEAVEGNKAHHEGQGHLQVDHALVGVVVNLLLPDLRHQQLPLPVLPSLPGVEPRLRDAAHGAAVAGVARGASVGTRPRQVAALPVEALLPGAGHLALPVLLLPPLRPAQQRR